MSTRYYSSDNFEDEERIVGEALGWKTEKFERKSKTNNNILNILNSKVLLKDIFDIFNIEFEEKYSPSGWTHYRNCPFPNHNDSSPSFYYNPNDNFFNCFGCKEKGKAINFVSAYKGVTVYEASDIILDLISGINLESIEENNKKDQVNAINTLLLSFSNSVNCFLSNNKTKDAKEFIEKITWTLDIYLHTHMQDANINPKHLKSIIKILLRKIYSYGR
jgi:hypothetical protein